MQLAIHVTHSNVPKAPPFNHAKSKMNVAPDRLLPQVVRDDGSLGLSKVFAMPHYQHTGAGGGRSSSCDSGAGTVYAVCYLRHLSALRQGQGSCCCDAEASSFGCIY